MQVGKYTTMQASCTIPKKTELEELKSYEVNKNN